MKVSFFQCLSYCRLYGKKKPVTAYSVHKTIIIFHEILLAVTLYTYLSSEYIVAQKDIVTRIFFVVYLPVLSVSRLYIVAW
jgi:hypothetical protein